MRIFQGCDNHNHDVSLRVKYSPFKRADERYHVDQRQWETLHLTTFGCEKDMDVEEVIDELLRKGGNSNRDLY